MGYHFEEIEHTADIAIRVRGRTLAELFANAAYGMACHLTEPATLPPTAEQRIELEAYDAETLLVSWLGELLYLSERDGNVFISFDVDVRTEESGMARLCAVARGGPAAEWRTHIKAVTFSNLRITHSDEGYETTVVFDV